MIKQTFHHYEEWEDYQCGMYDELNEGRAGRVELARSLLSSPDICERWMREVVKRWKIASEQVFSNPHVNRKPWLGQAACCLYAGVKEDETREAWWQLSDDERNTANAIAQQVINEWEDERLPSRPKQTFFNF